MKHRTGNLGYVFLNTSTYALVSYLIHQTIPPRLVLNELPFVSIIMHTPSISQHRRVQLYSLTCANQQVARRNQPKPSLPQVNPWTDFFLVCGTPLNSTSPVAVCPACTSRELVKRHTVGTACSSYPQVIQTSFKIMRASPIFLSTTTSQISSCYSRSKCHNN